MIVAKGAFRKGGGKREHLRLNRGMTARSFAGESVREREQLHISV